MSFRRPQFEDLTLEEQEKFGNGVGPGRFPTWIRDFLTERVGWFFAKASWRHHDFGYAIGGDEFDRWRCDWKFLRAMLKDGMTQDHVPWVVGIPIATGISVIFFLCVLIGGWLSFNYDKVYATTQEALETFVEQRGERTV